MEIQKNSKFILHAESKENKLKRFRNFIKNYQHKIKVELVEYDLPIIKPIIINKYATR